MSSLTAEKQPNNNKTQTKHKSTPTQRRQRYDNKKEYENNIKQELLNALTPEQLFNLFSSLNKLTSKSFSYIIDATPVDNKKYKLILTLKNK